MDQQSGTIPHADDAAGFAHLAQDLHADQDRDVTAGSIIKAVADLVPGTEMASLTIRARRGRYRTLAASEETAERADVLQYELEEGPCVQASTGSPWLRSGSADEDERWLTWGRRVRADLGVRAVLALQLLEREQPVGAINLYSRERDAFSDTDTVDAACIYALHATSALAAATEITGLRTALTTRHTIGMAQGMLMLQYGLDEDDSFQFMRRLASDQEVKLHEIARRIVETRAAKS